MILITNINLRKRRNLHDLTLFTFIFLYYEVKKAVIKMDQMPLNKYQGVKNFTLVARMQKIVAQQMMNLQ